MIEPMYTLEQAVELIPMPSAAALYAFLCQHPEVAGRRYKRRGGPKTARCGYVQRMLSESEILRIRDLTINESVGARFFKGVRLGRPRKNASDGVIASIMRRAMA